MEQPDDNLAGMEGRLRDDAIRAAAQAAMVALFQAAGRTAAALEARSTLQDVQTAYAIARQECADRLRSQDPGKDCDG